MSSHPDVCVFCHASGCLDGTADHSRDCPFTTGMWPVDAEMIRRETVCAACEQRFVEGDLCADVTDMSHPAVGGALDFTTALGTEPASVTFTVCLPCAALNEGVS